MPVSLRKPVYGFPKLRGLHLAHDRTSRVRTTLLLDELPKLRRAFIRAERLVEASGSVRHGVLDLPDVLHAPSEPLGHRLIRRGSFQLSPKLVVGAGHLAHLLAHVDGNPDGPPLLSNRPLHRLTYPPRSIGGEPKAPVGVELFNRPHKTYGALLVQILEGETTPTRLLGYRDNQPQVLLDESLAGSFVTLLGPLGEVYLLLVGQELALADSGKVTRNQLRNLYHSILALSNVNCSRHHLSTARAWRNQAWSSTLITWLISQHLPEIYYVINM